MSVQANNLLLLDENGLSRTIDTANDSLSVSVKVALGSDLSVGGNLSVAGDIISAGSQNVVVGDSFIDLNAGNSSTGASKAGGLAVNVKAANVATTVIAFAAGVASTSDAVFSVQSGGAAATYAAGDIIEISGCADFPGNNGLFVVSEVNNGTNVSGGASAMQSQIKVAGLSSAMPVNAPFAQNQFSAGTASASVYKVNLAVVAFSDGALLSVGDNSIDVGQMVSAYAESAWVGAGAAPAGRNKLYYEASQNVSLQEAYNVGSSIAMTYADGAFAVSPAAGETIGFSLAGSAASSLSTDGADLTVSTTTSGNIVLNSVGNIDADASDVMIDATAGISLSAAASSDFTSGADLSLDAATNLNLDAGTLLAATAPDITLDASAGISLDAAAASNFSVAGAGLTLATTTSGELALSSAGLMNVDAGADLDIDVTGTVDILSSGAFSIDGTGASNLSATSGNLKVSTLTSGNLILAAAADVDVDGVAVTIDATNGISLGAAATSDFSVAGASLTLQTTGSGDLDLNSAGDAFLDAAGISIDGKAASNFTVTGGQLTLSTVTSGELALTSAGLLNIDAGANADVDVVGNFELDATGFLSIAGASASDITIAAQMTVETTAAGANLVLTSANIMDINAPSGSLDADALSMTLDATAGGISIDATDASNFTVTGGTLMLQTNVTGHIQVWSAENVDMNAADVLIDATAGISLDAAAASNFSVAGFALTLSTSTAGNIEITSADDIVFSGDKAKFSATPVEFGSYAGVDVILGEAFSGAGLIGCWQSDAGTPKFYLSANNDASDDKRVVAAVGQLAGAANDHILAASVPGTLVPCKFAGTGPGAASVGKPVYLGTAGEVTLTAPTASGTTVYRVGYLASGSAVGGLFSVLFAPQFIAKRP